MAVSVLTAAGEDFPRKEGDLKGRGCFGSSSQLVRWAPLRLGKVAALRQTIAQLQPDVRSSRPEVEELAIGVDRILPAAFLARIVAGRQHARCLRLQIAQSLRRLCIR